MYTILDEEMLPTDYAIWAISNNVDLAKTSQSFLIFTFLLFPNETFNDIGSWEIYL